MMCKWIVSIVLEFFDEMSEMDPSCLEIIIVVIIVNYSLNRKEVRK